MFDSSPDIAHFLTSVIATREHLSSVYTHYLRRKLKVHWGHHAFGPHWTDSAIQYGLMVTGADNRNYELSARLWWPGSEWIIEADVSLEEEDAAGYFRYTTLRELPKRATQSWRRAVEDFRDAVNQLVTFEDLIPIAAGN